MAEKGAKPAGEVKQDKLLVFTIALDTESSAATYAGNMAVEQAFGLIQQILQSQERQRIRKEVEAEVKKKGAKT